MMKKNILALAMLIWAGGAWAQTLERAVLGAAGKVDARSEIVLEWTLGEMAVNRYTYPGGELNEGFHQPFLRVLPLEPGASDQRFHIFPNPTHAELFVQAQLRPQERVHLRLFDMLGRRVLPEKVVEGAVAEQLNLQQLPTGTYLLLITTNQGKPLHQAKVQKQ